MSTSPQSLVDSHVHIFRRDTPLLDNKWNPNGEEAPIESLIEVFDAHGISHGVISTSSIYGLNHEYFRLALKHHPDRLRATANVPLDISVVELRRLGDLGFVGTRLLWKPLPEVPDLGDAAHQSWLRRLADSGWHVHLTDRPERLEQTVDSLHRAGVRVIVDHLGMIDTPDSLHHPAHRALLRAVDQGRTWVKLSGAFRYSERARAMEQASSLVAAGGWERLMWGSDWPFVGHMGRVTYADALALLEQAVPDPAMRQAIGSGTALAFFFA